MVLTLLIILGSIGLIYCHNFTCLPQLSYTYKCIFALLIFWFCLPFNFCYSSSYKTILPACRCCRLLKSGYLLETHWFLFVKHSPSFCGASRPIFQVY